MTTPPHFSLKIVLKTKMWFGFNKHTEFMQNIHYCIISNIFNTKRIPTLPRNNTIFSKSEGTSTMHKLMLKNTACIPNMNTVPRTDQKLQTRLNMCRQMFRQTAWCKMICPQSFDTLRSDGGGGQRDEQMFSERKGYNTLTSWTSPMRGRSLVSSNILIRLLDFHFCK